MSTECNSARRERLGLPPLRWGDEVQPLDTWLATWKPLGDRLMALPLLVVATPVVLLAMVLVRLTSRGPAIYSQDRLGRAGRVFTIYKIRTMYRDCEARTGPCWSIAGDSRITPVGRVLRRTHLDELPQLWNVLRGEMSLIGPRPERPEIVGQLERVIPRYRERLGVDPGVTGLAQIRLPADTDLESVERKLSYDLHYIRHAGPWLDLRILIATGLGLLGIRYAASCAWLRIPCLKATVSIPSATIAKVAEKEMAAAQPSYP